MMKKLVASALVGASIVGGAASLAALPAQAQTSSPDQTQQAQPDKPDHKGNGQHQGRRHRLAKAAIKTSADTIGIDAKDLLKELKAGKSIADVATEHGVNPQAVVDAIVAKVNAKVDEAVAAGKITADKGNEIKAKAPEKVTKLVNAHRQPKDQKDQSGN